MVIFFLDILIEEVLPRTTVALIEGSLGGRRDPWYAGMRIIQDYPILGVGKGNFGEYSGNYLPLQVRMTGAWKDNVGPHNVYLAIQAELGIFGSIIFFAFLLRIFKGIKKLKKYNLGIMIWMLGLYLYLLVGGMGNTIYGEKYYWLVYTVIIALLNLRKENLPKLRF